MNAETLSTLPPDIAARINFGLYGGEEQFFIVGVDGTLAQLGDTLPNHSELRDMIANADVAHQQLLRERFPNHTKSDFTQPTAPQGV